MADEKKKWLAKAIVRKSLDEVANDLEDMLNQLTADGYQPAMEVIRLPDDQKSIGILITAAYRGDVSSALKDVLEQVAASAEDSVGDAPRFVFDSGSSRTRLSRATSTWLGSLFVKISEHSWAGAEKEIPALLPAAIAPLTHTQRVQFASDLENEATDHASVHQDDTCRAPLVLNLIADSLRSSLKDCLS